MKKRSLIFVFAIIMLLVLASCSEASDEELDKVYKINVNNKEFIVDTATQTITDGENEYTYTFKDNTARIYYPDNSSYWWTFTDNGGYGGWSDDYDENKYIDGDTLISALDGRAVNKHEPKKEQKVYNPIGLLFIALGIFNIAKPEKAWYFARGWQFKNSEPSDEALVVERLTGGIAIIMGLCIFFV